MVAGVQRSGGLLEPARLVRRSRDRVQLARDVSLHLERHLYLHRHCLTSDQRCPRYALLGRRARRGKLESSASRAHVATPLFTSLTLLATRFAGDASSASPYIPPFRGNYPALSQGLTTRRFGLQGMYCELAELAQAEPNGSAGVALACSKAAGR